MQNKKIIIGLIISTLILVVGGGIFVLSSSKKQTLEQPEISQGEQIEEIIDTLSPEAIGLTLTKTADERKVVMTISKVDDIQSLEYQLSYTSKGDIPRGAIGTDIMPKGKAVRQEIVLGTCSDVCHYDEAVSDIKLIVRVTKTDSKVYSVEKNL